MLGEEKRKRAKENGRGRKIRDAALRNGVRKGGRKKELKKD